MYYKFIHREQTFWQGTCHAVVAICTTQCLRDALVGLHLSLSTWYTVYPANIYSRYSWLYVRTPLSSLFKIYGKDPFCSIVLALLTLFEWLTYYYHFHLTSFIIHLHHPRNTHIKWWINNTPKHIRLCACLIMTLTARFDFHPRTGLHFLRHPL